MGDESSCTCESSKGGMPCNTSESASALNITISVFVNHLKTWLDGHAEIYSSEQPNVNINVVHHNITSDGVNTYAKTIADDEDGTQHGYHGFISYPHLFGIHKDNIHEIGDFVRRNEEKIKWSDILAFYRQNNAVNGNGGIYFIPLDDNANLIFYRKDLFSDHNITIPRTWEEFNSAAKYFHNANLTNKNNDVPVSGSCVRRHERCGMGLTISMITGTIAQVAGTNQGSLFDPVLQTFVHEVVLNKVANLIEEQVKYGHPEDFKQAYTLQDCITSVPILKGECALTYGVPSMFLSTPMQKFMAANIGFAPLPGSVTVWNRQSNTLEPCDSKTCVYGKSFDDIGIVNYSPYLNPNSVVGGVSKWASDEERQSVLEFFSYVSINSFDDAVPNISDNITVVQPYRRSHLNVSRWIAQGYDEEEALRMIASYESPNDPNANVSPRIGEFSGFLEELSIYTSSHLSNAVQGNVTDSDRTDFVTSISDLADRYFENNYTGGKEKFYEDYQKSLGIYDPAVEKYLSVEMMVYGVVLGCLVVLSAIGIGCWIYWNRFDKLNKFFRPVLMIWTCVGSTLVGMGICIMAITDDDRFPVETCDHLCNVMYCLFVLGQSMILWVSGAKIICNFEVSNAKWFNRQYHLISNFDMLRSALMTLIPTLCCLGGFMIFDQPKWERIPSDGDNTGLDNALPEVWGQCSRTYFSSYFLGVNVLLFVVMTVMSVIALFCCSRDRLEKPWQFLVLSAYLQSLIIGIPMLILFSDRADSLYISFVTLHFFIAMGPLIIPMIPLTIIRQQIEEKYILMAKNAAKREAALSGYKETLRKNIANIEEILRSNNDFKRSRHLKRIRRSADKWLRSDLCDFNDSDEGARREYRRIRLQKMESRIRKTSVKYKDGDLNSAKRPVLRHTGKSFSKMSRFSVEFLQFAGPSQPNSRLGSLRHFLSFRASSGTHTFGGDYRNSNENGVIFNDEEISSESLCDECDSQTHEN